MKRNLLLWAMAGGFGAIAIPCLALASPTAPAWWQQSRAVSVYQDPDGSYPSYDAFYRDLEGVPCGIECAHMLAVERHHSGW